MKVSEPYEEYAGKDLILNAFGSIANTTNTRDVVFFGHVSVVRGETFAETLTSNASNTEADLIIVPWSETGTLSELPSYFIGGAQRDPLTNREFARLTDDLFATAKPVSSISVYVNKTLLKTLNDASSHGITPADNESNYGEHRITFASGNGKTNIHVLYTSTADDFFAVKLALQLAKNPAVNLTITKLSPPSFLSSETAHLNDTSFNDLQTHGALLAANKVTFNKVDAASLSKEVIIGLSGDTMFIVGRSVTDVWGPDISRIKSGDATYTFGVLASNVVQQIRSRSVDASVIVLQEKESSVKNIRRASKIVNFISREEILELRTVHFFPVQWTIA